MTNVIQFVRRRKLSIGGLYQLICGNDGELHVRRSVPRPVNIYLEEVLRDAGTGSLDSLEGVPIDRFLAALECVEADMDKPFSEGFA